MYWLILATIGGHLVASQRLPAAFSGVVQEEQTTKKNSVLRLPTVEGCWNKHECCDSLHSMGQCVHFRDDLKSWCPVACGFCRPTYDTSVECEDRHKSCAQWAKDGRCKEQEYWMSENCRQSCRKCSRSRAQTCPGTRLDCSQAPTAGIRLYCEQLQRWDEGARRNQFPGHEVALPPGSHSLADLAP